MLDVELYCKLINNGVKYIYNMQNKTCEFLNKEESVFSMTDIGDWLNSFGDNRRLIQQSYKESLDHEKYKNWSKQIRHKRGNRCQLSGLNIHDVDNVFLFKFNEQSTKLFFARFLVLHHISGKREIEDYDESNMLVLNNGVHLFLHRPTIFEFLPILIKNWELQVELGALIPHNGKYFWQN